MARRAHTPRSPAWILVGIFVAYRPISVSFVVSFAAPSPQADTKPGCVLRPANVVEVLQRKRNLLTNDDVETCKGGMNTWAYVGDLNDHPQLSCVYQSDDAQNEFLSNPKVRFWLSCQSLSLFFGVLRRRCRPPPCLVHAISPWETSQDCSCSVSLIFNHVLARLGR